MMMGGGAAVLVVSLPLFLPPTLPVLLLSATGKLDEDYICRERKRDLSLGAPAAGNSFKNPYSLISLGLVFEKVAST